MAKLIKMPLDCETYGTDENTSCLLTLFMCVVDDDYKVYDFIDLKLKPDDGLCFGQQDALEVNGINIEEHIADPNTLTYTEGSKVVQAFIDKHHQGGRWATLQPSGHNIEFDLRYIKKYLIPDAIWKKKVHYRLLDTMPLATFFKAIGKWPEKIGSLVSIVEFLGLKMRPAHNAKEDTLMWIDVFVEIVRREKALLSASGSSNTMADDIIILEL